jgi:hypothetical protein
LGAAIHPLSDRVQESVYAISEGYRLAAAADATIFCPEVLTGFNMLVTLATPSSVFTTSEELQRLQDVVAAVRTAQPDSLLGLLNKFPGGDKLMTLAKAALQAQDNHNDMLTVIANEAQVLKASPANDTTVIGVLDKLALLKMRVGFTVVQAAPEFAAFVAALVDATMDVAVGKLHSWLILVPGFGVGSSALVLRVGAPHLFAEPGWTLLNCH